MLVPQREYVIFAQILVDRPSALGAGLNDEHIAGLEGNGRLALDLDGAASREQMAVFPGVVVDFPNSGGGFPDAGEDFAVVGGMQIPGLGMRITAHRGSRPRRIILHGCSQIAQRQQSIGHDSTLLSCKVWHSNASSSAPQLPRHFSRRPPRTGRLASGGSRLLGAGQGVAQRFKYILLADE